MADFKFSPKKVAEAVEQKLAIHRLPSWAQETEQIQKYFDDAIQQWFTPEQQRTIDGYVGTRGGSNSAGKTFIKEMTNERAEYQLAPAMVSTTKTNEVLSMITYPDLVDHLGYNGCLSDNASRLLSGRTYSWAPPVNPDMIMNYSNYYWDTTNSEGMLVPDYIVMERGARDGNAWSVANHWYPVEYTDENGVEVKITTDDIKEGRFIQAQRPIVEYIKDMQLYNYGRYSRGSVDLVSDVLRPEQIVHRSILDDVRIDGEVLRNGDRILFTSIANAGENNRIYIVELDRLDGIDVYSLKLDVSEQTDERPSGEPMDYDTIRCLRGSSYGGWVLNWTGTSWDRAQHKPSTNSIPKFNLYDKNGVALDDSTVYPSSDFAGSSVFAVKLDPTYPTDSVYNLNIKKDQYGSISYENHLETDVFTYTSRGETINIDGAKFYAINDENPALDALYSDWLESSIPSRQYVTQTIEPTTYVVNEETGETAYNDEYELAVSVGVNPPGVNYPLVRVDISGTTLRPEEYEITNKTIKLKVSLNEDSRIGVRIINTKETPNTDLGVYEIPSNLKHNANNNIITDIDESRLADHFYDIIQSQEDFQGSALGINNYYTSDRDLSVGRRIVQHDASLLPLMLHASNDRLDILKAVDFAKIAYNNFKSKFLNRLEDISNAGFGSLSANQVVQDILTKINVGKSNEFAFWLSGMASSSSNGQTFIPPTPQYLGILPAVRPEIRKKMEIDGIVGVYNRSHTGSLSRAFSSLDENGNVVTDFRDDVVYQLENLIYRSISLKFRSEQYVPALSVTDVRPGLYRTTDYTRDEWKQIELRSFEQWAISNNIDHHTNNTFDQANWLTWNLTGTHFVKDTLPVFGNYKSALMFVFDSWRPHTHPWECLGFETKPLWWDDEYITDDGIDDAIEGAVYLDSGEKSYTNPLMIQDLKDGFIRSGDRKGIDPRFARPDMIWPVDDTTGALIPLWDCGIIDREPSLEERMAEWSFGDMGPVEFAYMNSNFDAFERAIVLYRAKPAQWANYYWDTDNYSLVQQTGGQTQWLHDTKERRLYIDREETIVHGEIDTRVIGYQMWVSDFLKHNHVNITSAYGDIIRGAGVKLAYRLGGFSKNENLTFVSDNFGLVSQENQQIHLLKSAPRRQEVISGVQVRYSGKRYVINGYNSSNPRFTYFKPVTTGKRSTVRIGNKSLVLYKEFDTKNPVEVNYDTRFKTHQEVFDFLIGYGKYLESRGWIFEDQVDGETFDWRFMAAGFVNWSQGDIKDGDFITLTPAANTLKFATEHGNIDSVTQFSGGAWTLVDENNSGIGMQEINVSRIGNILNIRLLENVDKRIMLARVNVNEYEHAVVFDNTTIFNDIMYLPDFGLHQARLRVYGNVSDMWNGRLEAPGFMIVDDTTLPNFEKLVNDFKHYYDNETPGTSVELNDLARHAIGFQSREWLRRLILNDRSQVDFYKGFIKEKGTVQSFDKILRASKELRTPDYKVIEEWAFLAGEYGDIDSQQYMEFLVQGIQIQQDPQYCIFNEAKTEDNPFDDVVTFYGKEGVDPRWITRSKSTKFPTTTHSRVGYLPDYGPVTLTEVDTVVDDLAGLSQAVASKNNLDTVWMLNNNNGWDIIERTNKNVTITSLDPDTTAGFEVPTITLSDDHNLIDGDICYFSNGLQSSSAFYYSTGSNNTITASVPNTLEGMTLYVYKSRFADKAARDAYIKSRERESVDMTRFDTRPVIYNRKTNLTETYLTLWDPIEGIIPGTVDVEVDFKSQTNPAILNSGDTDNLTTEAWGRMEVGKVWWDTTNARYIDYKQAPVRKDGTVEAIDSDETINYRRNNWGKMLPGSTIDVYEWVRSPVPPVEWAEYVEKQAALNKATTSWTPSGEARDDGWCEHNEYDVNSGEFKRAYYFWVKDSYTVPNVPGRDRSVGEIARIISDPSELGLPWFGPVAADAYILSGINTIISDDQSVLQIAYKSMDNAGNIHKQWRLFQEGSDYFFDDDMWSHMIDSLVGEHIDVDGSSVSTIYPVAHLGNGPKKTWFKDIIKARREFVSACNAYFETVNISGDLIVMNDVFNYAETALNPYEREFTVVEYNGENVIQVANAERFANGDSIILNTDGELPMINTEERLDSSRVYFIERVPNTDDKFYINATVALGTNITLVDKGVGKHTILRSADATAQLSNALDMTDYWDYVDWYAEGYSSDTPFTEVASLNAANQMDFALGDVIRVTDDDGNWTLYARNFSRDIGIWETVGRYNSTIKLNDNLLVSEVFYDENGEVTELERITRQAIRLLATAFGSSQSRIVFPMVYYVHHEQPVVDWVYKTSYVSILGIDKTLDNAIVTHNDAISDVLEYINEVKPYRTKIRSSIVQRTSDADIIKATMNDVGVKGDLTGWEDLSQAYFDEWAKDPEDRNFSNVVTNFRQSQEVVFFDQVSATPDDSLIKSTELGNFINKVYDTTDPLNILPAEVIVSGIPNRAYNGTYIELIENDDLPVLGTDDPTFSSDFSPSGDLLIDRTAKVYRHIEYPNLYIWKQVGLGWMITQNRATTHEWYYENTNDLPLLSVENPYDVVQWVAAGQKPASDRDTRIEVAAIVKPSIDTRLDTLQAMNLSRYERSNFRFNQNVVALLREKLNEIAGTELMTDEQWVEGIKTFVIGSSVDSYLNPVAFADYVRSIDGSFTDEQIIEVMRYGMQNVVTETNILNTANRIKIFNPDATAEYIESVLSSQFSGCQIANQPNFRGNIGYSAINDRDEEGYYIWDDILYKKMFEKLVDEGYSENDAILVLREYGFSAITNYVPYLDQVDDTVTRSSFIKGANGPLNGEEYNKENPFTNESLRRIGDYVDDVSNYDNLGYEKTTRTVQYNSVDENTWVYDIDELDVESDQFGNFVATLTSYRPDVITPVDYGDYNGNGSFGELPTEEETDTNTHAEGSENYGDFDDFDVFQFTWDFGTGYGKGVEYRNGSFSLEGVALRNPNNPQQVIISSPRSTNVTLTSNLWNRDPANFDVNVNTYTDLGKKLYSFKFDSGTETSDQIRDIVIGQHNLIDGDTVLLFSTKGEPTPNSIVEWDNVEKLYQVKVIDHQTVRLYSMFADISNPFESIVFDATNLDVVQGTYDKDTRGIPYSEGESRLYQGYDIMFSMFHVIAPRALSDVYIDVLNYSEIYNRFMSGGELHDPLSMASADIIECRDHNLVTGDQIVFNSVGLYQDGEDYGNMTFGTTYFVSVVNDNQFKLTPSIEDAVISSNVITIGADISKASFTVVNYWITSTLTTTRRERQWHIDFNNINPLDTANYTVSGKQGDITLERQEAVDIMTKQFNAQGNLISLPTDEIVDQGFARPSIDAGSLRELVRPNMQEHLSITVIQDERGNGAAAGSQVRDKNNTLMYNKKAGSSKSFGFRMVLSPANQVMQLIRLKGDETVELAKDVWYNDSEITYTGSQLPTEGTVEINGEYIKYKKVNGNTISNMNRGDDYTHEPFVHRVGSKVNLVAGTIQNLSRVLVGDRSFSTSIPDTENYTHSSTILFDTNDDNTAFLALKDVDNDFVNELTEYTDVYYNTINK